MNRRRILGEISWTFCLLFASLLPACGARTSLSLYEHGERRDADVDDGDPADTDPDPDRDADAERDGDLDRDADPDGDSDPDGDIPQVDIYDALAAIDGMEVFETTSWPDGRRTFELYFEQPVNYADPDGQTFQQYLTLVHRDEEAPLIFVSTGYDNYIYDFEMELTVMLGANQLVVEHRYFAESTPHPTDWSFLTIEQAAWDHHRIVLALNEIYTGAWISTGASKGGMTSIYHRRFFPLDVAGTVAYVAPNSLNAPDERYIDFVANVGEEWCRDRLAAIQVEALTRREEMLRRFEEVALSWELTFELYGGIEGAFEDCIVSLPFLFWQYEGIESCPYIPGTSVSDSELFDFLDFYGGLLSNSDEALIPYIPYYYQAHTQLGYPAISTEHIDHMLFAEGFSLERALPGVPLSYSNAAMMDIADWVATEGSELMFVYGEWDPWTAGAFNIGSADDTFSFVVPAGTHGAIIWGLESADQLRALEALERWTGVRPMLTPGPRPVPMMRGHFREHMRMLRPIP